MRNVGRTRLLLWSAPVVVLVLLIVAKLTSMALAGGSAVEDYQRRDVDALRDDVSTMQVLDVVDPYSTAFAAGSLAVLEGGRLEDAEEHFATAVAHDATCPALTNLALVAETRGDQFTRVGDGPGALERYRSALATVTGAPVRCFAEPDEPDAERRDVLTGSAQRLNGKIALLERPLPPPPPPAAPPPPPPGGAPPPTAGSNRDTDDQERILLPGDPLDQLRQLLEDAAATRGAP